jgi:flavin reductase (DIM6/NTAB) family NADH-FMN oxidoreductase RutF
MLLTAHDISVLDRIERMNIINSLTGIKPANLIGTVSDEGITNLAIFSSVVHLGSNPPLLGFILRPHYEVKRDTYDNIINTKHYTINHIHLPFIKNAHYTSAKFERSVSEFDACNLTEEYVNDFKAPFVKESRLKMGMEFIQQIPIEINNTSMVIGKVTLAIIPDEVLEEDGHIDLSLIDDAGISGLNSYYSLKKAARFPYARPGEFPGDWQGQ